MGAMVIFLPLIVVLLVFGLLSGSTNIVLLLPMAVVLGAGAVFITIAMRDGRRTPDRSVRQLPTDHLRRQLYLALRPRRSGRRHGRNAKGEQENGSSVS
jgi:hypothetical protein